MDLQRVTVRGSGGKTAVCRVVSVRGGYVYVVSEKEYQRARKLGIEPMRVVGFRKEDVLYDEERPAV